MTKHSRIFTIASLAVLAPSLAFASTTTDLVSQIAGLLYIIVGLALTVSVLMMVGGIIMWILRLGTSPTYRDGAIRLMEWSIATLFTLVLVLGVVEFIQTHTSLTLYILSIVILLLFVWLLATSGILSGGGSEKKEER